MRRVTPSGKPRASPDLMPCFFWYCSLHLSRWVAIRRASSGSPSNRSSQTGNTRRRWFPMTPT